MPGHEKVENSASRKSAGFGGHVGKSAESCYSRCVKRLARRWFPRQYEAHRLRRWQAADPYANDEQVSGYPARMAVRLGILKEFAHQHKYYVGACRELGVPYRILDLSGSDWVNAIRHSGCDAFLISPSCELSVWKRMFDERLRTMVVDLGKIIYPTYDELWLYESKLRMCYWLHAHRCPCPETHVFYDYGQAMSFAQEVKLPIVAKTDFGSAALGVRVFRSRPQLMRWTKRCFNKGILCRDEDPRDRQWGVVLYQEYLPNVREWRIVRIGTSYFGYEKLKAGDYHSGSLQRAYHRPSDDLLSFSREVMDVGGFTSMGLDVFETNDGRYLVNELQAQFGMSRPEMCVVDGTAGRMVFQCDTRSWAFESGDFCRNHLCNLRVQTLLTMLERRQASS